MRHAESAWSAADRTGSGENQLTTPLVSGGPADVGQKVRALRQEQRLTITALAERAGISRAWLGSVEHGTTTPSIDTVRRLAKALGVTLVSILDPAAAELGEAADQGGSVELVRRSERMALRFPSQTFFWEVLTPLHGELGILMADVSPSAGPPELVQHEGIESYLVLEGQLTIHVGDRRYELAEGDCLTFPAGISHGTVNAGRQVARVMNVTTPSDFGASRHARRSHAPLVDVAPSEPTEA